MLGQAMSGFPLDEGVLLFLAVVRLLEDAAHFNAHGASARHVVPAVSWVLIEVCSESLVKDGVGRLVLMEGDLVFEVGGACVLTHYLYIAYWRGACFLAWRSTGYGSAGARPLGSLFLQCCGGGGRLGS